jgi:DNA-binding NarL/FixJ family response regulator
VPQEIDADAELTSTERRILRLVESGASIHDVGQQLFMTPNTVERHLEAARARSAGTSEAGTG